MAYFAACPVQEHLTHIFVNVTSHLRLLSVLPAWPASLAWRHDAQLECGVINGVSDACATKRVCRPLLCTSHGCCYRRTHLLVDQQAILYTLKVSAWDGPAV